MTDPFQSASDSQPDLPPESKTESRTESRTESEPDAQQSSGASANDAPITAADREQAKKVLTESLSAGLLNHSEFEERSGAIRSAHNRGDLQALLFDLPGGHLDGRLTPHQQSQTPVSHAASSPSTTKPSATAETPQQREPESSDSASSRTVPWGALIALSIALALIPAIWAAVFSPRLDVTIIALALVLLAWGVALQRRSGHKNSGLDA